MYLGLLAIAASVRDPLGDVRSRSLHCLLRVAYELGVWRKTVVDEAHCIDEQGREFRVDANKLAVKLWKTAFEPVVTTHRRGAVASYQRQLVEMDRE